MARGVGRERESGILEEALSRAHDGRGGLVRIVGEPGIGKSWLASALADHAAERGIEHAWARAWERAATTPYGIIRELARALRRDELIAALARSRDGTFAAVTHALTERDTTLLVVFDDLHAADLDSLELLVALAPSLRSSRTLVVATQRSVDTAASGEQTALLDALARVSSVVELGGLDVAAVAAMMEAISGRHADERVATAVHRATLGNALFVEGVVRRAVSDGTLETGTIRVPPDVRRAIMARVESAGESVAAVLRVGAVIGRPFVGATIAEVLGQDIASIETALAVAVDTGLMTNDDGRYAFRHTLVGDVVTSSLAASKRAALHAAVADVLTSPEDLARHHASAVSIVGLDVALRSIDRAAHGAASVFAYEEAVRHRRDAVALVDAHASTDDARTLAALLALGEAWLAAGKRGEARRRLVEAAAIARRVDDAPSFARAALGVADTGEFGAVDREKVTLLEEAKARLGTTTDALATRVASRLAAELWADPASAERRRKISRDVVDAARARGDAGGLFDALDARFQALWGPSGRSERRTTLDELRSTARALPDDAERSMTIHRHALFLAVEDGDLAAFVTELDALASVGAPLHRPAIDETIAQRRLLVVMARGDLGAAAVLTDDVRARGREIQNPQAEMGHCFVRSLIASDAGHADELEACVDGLRVHADRLAHLPFLRARLAVALALVGRRDAAQIELDVLVSRALPALDDGMTTMASLALSAEAAWLLHDTRAATVIAPMIAPFADRAVAVGSTIFLGSARRYIGLLAWTLGQLDLAREALALAHADHERMNSPPWIARSARELAHLVRRNGEIDRANALHDAALRFRERGIDPLGAPDDAPAPAVSSQTRASFVRAGQGWTLDFDAAHVQLRDTKGLRLLAVLLASPGAEHHVLDLVGAAEIRSASGSAGPALDAAALTAYRARIVVLHEKQEDADARGDEVASLRCRTEIEAIEDELSSAMGLGGRERASGAVERARVAVAKAFERALATIREHHPVAAAHLARSLRTGAFCSYDPDPGAKIVWTVTS